MHMQTKTLNDVFEDAISNQENFEGETKDVPTETMVHNFVDSEIIQDYDKILWVASSENGLFVVLSEKIHPIESSKINIVKNLIFQHCFMIIFEVQKYIIISLIIR